MKNYFLFLFLLLGLFGKAQFVNNIAPDFTVTDIYGNQHNLYSYLNSGKTVILEFSSTSCGADWKYDRTEAMQDFYNAFGPPGSNEIMVLYINNSNSDTIQELNGIANPPTFGNWIQGKPFPMVLDPNIFSQYSINATPNIYKICPNKIIQGMGQPSATSCFSQVNYGCGTINGVNNYVRLIETKNGFCNSNGSFKAKVKNYGSNPVSSITLKLKENNVVINTKTFATNIAQFSEVTLEFDSIIINPSSNYTVEVENVNGVSNYNNSFSFANLPFSLATNPASLNLHLKVHTYVCPNNMTWKITNSSETVVANGGPYGTPGSSCNGPMNTIVEHDIVLPAGDCYNLSLMDYNGFGWKNYSGNSPVPTNAGIEFYSNGTLIYSKMNVENFGSLLEFKNFLTTHASLDNPSFEFSNYFSLYPNPAANELNINMESAIEINSIQIYNTIGQLVTVQTGNALKVDVSHLKTGNYFIKINTNEGYSTSQFIKE